MVLQENATMKDLAAVESSHSTHKAEVKASEPSTSTMPTVEMVDVHNSDATSNSNHNDIAFIQLPEVVEAPVIEIPAVNEEEDYDYDNVEDDGELLDEDENMEEGGGMNVDI